VAGIDDFKGWLRFGKHIHATLSRDEFVVANRTINLLPGL